MTNATYSVNIRELVKLLGGRLYKEPEIVLRELISNASDACTFSQAYTADPRKYQIEVYHESPNQLVIRDNGRGLTQQEIVKHLATVANPSKREQSRKLRQEHKGEFADRIIGEFGLGFLSTFVITYRVVVETVSEQTLEGWRWESNGDTTYTLQPFPDSSPGTTVRLFLDTNKYSQFSGTRFVRDEILKYSHQIAIPIYFGVGDERIWINEAKAPWDASGPDATARWQQYLAARDTFNDAADWISALAFNTELVQGLLYFPPYQTSLQRPLGLVEVYYRNVLVEQNNSELLLPAVRCVRGMLQSAHWQRQVSGSELITDDTVREVQKFLERKVIEHLVGLAASTNLEDATKLQRILEVHSEILLEGLLALADHDVFSQLAEIIPFQTTTHASTTLLAYLERAQHNLPNQQRRIFYFTQGQSNRQIATLAHKRGWELLDCKLPHRASFVKRYADIKNIRLDNVRDDIDLLFDVVEADGGWVHILDYYNDRLVFPAFRVQAKLSHNSNAEMPLVLLDPDKGKASDQLLRESGLGSGRQGLGERRTLYVNKNNLLMQQLAAKVESKAIAPDLLELVLHDMFHQSALLSDEVLDTVHMLEHHQKLLERLVLLSEDVQRIQLQQEHERIRIQTNPIESGTGQARNTVFVGMPFKEPYLDTVYEMAIKPAITKCGLEPVMLGEEHMPGDIPREIVEGIAQASVVVFDVSEASPNVYYELGLAHGYNKVSHTILIRNKNAPDPLPFDTRQYRVLEYVLHPRDFETFRQVLYQTMQNLAYI
jgi:molecular chaperone HtpG